MEDKLKLPDVFFKNSDYIILPELKTFISENIDNTFDEKEKLVEKIEDFANQSKKNKELVLEYFHEALRYGKKDINLYRYNFPNSKYDKNYQQIKTIMEGTIKDKSNFIEAPYTNEFTPMNLTEYQTKLGNAIFIDFTRKVYIADDNNQYFNYELLSSIGLIPEEKIFFVITKSKPNMLISKEEDAKNLTTAGIFDELKNFVLTNLEVELDKEVNFERKLFLMVGKYTQTPSEVKLKIDIRNTEINEVIDLIQKKLNLTNENKEYLRGDIENIFEKYISINEPDNSIFIKESLFYVTQLKSKDIEQTTFTEHSMGQDPIHSKMAFFNNKQNLIANSMCNEAIFNGKRKDSKYYSIWYKCKIVAKRECVLFKFYEYTRKEDIINAIYEFYKQ